VTYPQQGGYGPPQGGYGPQPGGYPPPGYPPPGPGGYGQYPPPKKSNTGLIVGIVSAIVVVAVAVVLVVVLTNGDDDKDTAGDNDSGSGESVEIPGPNMPKPGGSGSDSGSDSGGSDSGSGSADSPQALADSVVDIIETQDAGAIDPLACNSNDAGELKSELSKLAGMDVSATVEDVQESGDTASASIKMRAGGQSEGFTVEMAKQDGSWCASGI
jgi:hypothetical protein